MKIRNKWIIIWIAINIILIGNYVFHSYSIRCEPCMEGFPCPPCETPYMKEFWKYFIGWNLMSVFVYVLLRKWR